MPLVRYARLLGVLLCALTIAALLADSGPIWP